jgi:hypothetical protein
MIRVREETETELHANLAPEWDEPATVNGPRSRKDHKKQLLTAKADGGPVILGNGGEIRSTRANAVSPLGLRRAGVTMRLLSPACLRASIAMCGLTLI